MNKVVVITGTSTGLGLATAVLFAKNNYTVYATMRNLAKKDLLLAAAKKEKVSVQVEELDVTKTRSVQNCINKIIKKKARLIV